jgi:hypothetical protein
MAENLVSLGEKIVQVPFNLPRTRAVAQGANPLVAFLESGFDGCKLICDTKDETNCIS